ncbi:hypothetical protein [Nonomuraea sp. SYSU D8015]|uniref:hypothetical protein n=1 Tax=Nonomuraea sp. SYSU D8015 TaxID=2593644 RepID=UPI0016617FA0|nr:hypothetical protein [Nonomuraea sp. SYSU D8015]
MDEQDPLVDAPVKYDMTATNLVFRRSEDTGDWVTGVAYHVRPRQRSLTVTTMGHGPGTRIRWGCADHPC